MAMHVQLGFDLRRVKHYGTQQRAIEAVEAQLAPMIKAGIMFNILVVEQRRGGTGTDAEDRRYVPLLNCWRVPQGHVFTDVQCMVHAGRKGFTCFR